MQKGLGEGVVTSPSIQADRGVDCVIALIPAFRRLVVAAEQAGWTEEEVASALLALTHVYGDKPALSGTS